LAFLPNRWKVTVWYQAQVGEVKRRGWINPDPSRNDDAANSPQTAMLNGIGIAP